MWDLPNLVLLQKARNALKDGRLDEAYSIVTDDKLCDHRQGQVLKERLVPSLLERARKHLGEGRIQDALADVERAQRIGGNQPEIARLRQEVLSRVKSRQKRERHERDVLASVRGHVDAGRLDEGAERLEDLPEAGHAAGNLRRRLGNLRRTAEERRGDVEAALGRGELEQAVEALRGLRSVAGEEAECRRLEDEVLREVDAAVAVALTEGELGRARRLLRGIDDLEAKRGSLVEWRETLALCDKTAAAIGQGDWPSSLVYIGRLRKLLPSARWVATCEKRLRHIDENVREVRSGPLGEIVSDCRPRRRALGDTAVTRAAEPPSSGATPVAPEPAPAAAATGRYVMWVDGVGSFLLLRSDCLTIGRIGSSTHPDVGLAADLEGVHAQIVRADDDYFVVARGPVSVGGERVTRHLLTDGDRMTLGSRTRLTFRLPSSLSGTALLELGSGLRLPGDVRKVVLLDRHLIFGPGSGAHLTLSKLDERVILTCEKETFRLRAKTPVFVDGRPLGEGEPVPLGAHIEVGGLTFTMTAVAREGETT
ncbi:MAG: FHA domain-containing protein [Planctomycetota bacterium]|nr:FHA domain-containing protein [Planctomycetota bacterium]